MEPSAVVAVRPRPEIRRTARVGLGLAFPRVPPMLTDAQQGPGNEEDTEEDGHDDGGPALIPVGQCQIRSAGEDGRVHQGGGERFVGHTGDGVRTAVKLSYAVPVLLDPSAGGDEPPHFRIPYNS